MCQTFLTEVHLLQILILGFYLHNHSWNINSRLVTDWIETKTHSAIKGVKEGVSSSVSYTATAMGLSSFTIVNTLTSESSLVNFTVLKSAERHAIVFELNNSLGGFLTHVMDCVLISQPIRSLHCVVKVIMPMILLHVSKGCIDTSLL